MSETNKEIINTKYVAGSAFSLPVENDSVDLLSVAQGLHWLTPYDLFFHEVKRVLRSNGIFCAVGYKTAIILNVDAQKIFRNYYENILGSLKNPGDAGCYWEVRLLLL